MELRIAHLSDIHFKREKNPIGINADDNMREDVVHELIKLTKNHGRLDALIVSGDIAFSGKAEEFVIARNWLYSILERTHSPNARIMVCPGNHDIDRDALNLTILDMHDKVRTESDVEKRQDLLLSRLADKQSRDLLMASLENYNQFAVEFGCEFYPNEAKYSWTHDLSLNDGSTLRIRALNTTILCGKKDTKRSLFLGRNSWSLKRQEGVEYLVFAHHPPSWLHDEVEMRSELDDRARLQMYGHEHSARIDPGGETVRLYAGAINPERDHASWVPGFNFLRLYVNTQNADRTLEVIVHSMQWQSTSPSQFGMYLGRSPDGTHRHSFKLSPWNPVDATKKHSPAVVVESHANWVNKMSEPLPPNQAPQNFLRRFFDLDFGRQKRILEELNLVEKAESSLPQFIQIKNALKRAMDKGLMNEVLKKIDETE